MSVPMKEYRCTRPEIYSPGSDGHEDPLYREGYYIYAYSSADALEEMHRRFPKDRFFEIRVWKVKK